MLARRYIHKEILKILIPSLVILVAVFLSSATVKYLNYAARGDISINFFPKLLMVELPGLIGILLPMAFFFSCLIAMSRLYAYNELVALRASGLDNRWLLRIVFSLAVPMALLVSVFIFWMRPYLLQVKGDLLAEAKANALIDMFKPGQFQQIPGDVDRTVYVESMKSKGKKVRGVFISSQKKTQPTPDVITARSGYHEKIEHAEYFVLERGVIYHGVPGERDYRLTHFKKYKTLIRPPVVERARDKIEALSTWSLFRHAERTAEMEAELQWRISIPLMLLILALISIPLSYVPPRTGVYVNVVPALILLVIYINGILVLRDALEDNEFPALLGMWWYHAVFVGLAYYLMKRRLR